MRYQKGSKALATLVAVMALAGAGCGLFDKLSGPSQTQEVNVNVYAPPSPPAASPTPSPSASPNQIGSVDLAEVRVPLVGENCPAGVTPANAQRTIRVGCSGFVTCTPIVRDASGALRPATPAEHGPAPLSFRIASGSGATFTQWATELFNGDARGVAPGGTARIECVVAGRGQNVGALDLVVIP